jgi:aminoglycoside phosphotransferase (APT) family kinase protein
VFTHVDLQAAHVVVEGDEIPGVIDWSEAARGDALFDIATLTLGHEERLADVVAGYGGACWRSAGWPSAVSPPRPRSPC